MSTVLWEEEVVVPAAVLEEDLSIPVPVTVLLVNGKIEFLPVDDKLDYSISKDSIALRGSGGTPREFVLAFALSTPMVEAGFKFANPALKFFQGIAAGFRFSPEPSEIEAIVALFNTKDQLDHKTDGSFSVLLRHPIQGLLSHDPSIVWDPPNG